MSITEGATQLQVGATQTLLRSALGPAGKTFTSPVTVTLAWADADDDGNVDGFETLAESELRVWRDGRLLAGPCRDAAFQAPACTTACCDLVANTWTLLVSGFSEFVVGVAEHVGVAGRMLLVKDKDGDASKRRVLVQSKDPSIATAGVGSDGDPTLHGARLFLVNPGTIEADAFELPASGWTALGNPPGSGGYKYGDPTLARGPCKMALVKPGKLFKAICQGSRIRFSLDEVAQAELAVTLQLGAAPAYCAGFGGTVVKDLGAANGRVGQFKAMNAPAPEVCPIP